MLFSGEKQKNNQSCITLEFCNVGKKPTESLIKKFNLFFYFHSLWATTEEKK